MIPFRQICKKCGAKFTAGGCCHRCGKWPTSSKVFITIVIIFLLNEIFLIITHSIWIFHSSFNYRCFEGDAHCYFILFAWENLNEESLFLAWALNHYYLKYFTTIAAVLLAKSDWQSLGSTRYANTSFLLQLLMPHPSWVLFTEKAFWIRWNCSDW